MRPRRALPTAHFQRNKRYANYGGLHYVGMVAWIAGVDRLFGFPILDYILAMTISDFGDG